MIRSHEKTPPKPPPMAKAAPPAGAPPLAKPPERRTPRPAEAAPPQGAVGSSERHAKRVAGAAASGLAFLVPQTQVTSFAISLGLHTVGLLGLAIIVVSHNLETPPRQLQFTPFDDDIAELDFQDMPEVEVAPLDEWEEMNAWDLPEDLAFETPDAAISIETDLLPVDPPARVEIDSLLEDAGTPAGGLMAAVSNANTGAPRGRGQGGGQGGGFGGELGRRLAREGAQSGSIQVSLLWNNLNDLDLHVLTPSGERIYYGHKQSQSRGCLDVDMNAGGRLSNEPVENIFWPPGSPVWGQFAIYVDYFSRHDPNMDKTAYEVHLLVDGEQQVFRGALHNGMQPILVTTFVRKPMAAEQEWGFAE